MLLRDHVKGHGRVLPDDRGRHRHFPRGLPEQMTGLRVPELWLQTQGRQAGPDYFQAADFELVDQGLAELCEPRLQDV